MKINSSIYAWLLTSSMFLIASCTEAQVRENNQGFPADMLLRISTNTIMESSRVLFLLGEEQVFNFNDLMQVAEGKVVQEDIWERAVLVQNKMNELDALCMDVIEEIDLQLVQIMDGPSQSLPKKQNLELKAQRKGPVQLDILNTELETIESNLDLVASLDSLLEDFQLRLMHLMCDYTLKGKTYFFPEVEASDLMQSPESIFMEESICIDDRYTLRLYNDDVVVARKMLTFSQMSSSNVEKIALLMNAQHQVLNVRLNAMKAWRMKVGSVISQ